MKLRRLAGGTVGYGALASFCYGVGVLGLVAIGSVHFAAVPVAAASLGLAPFAAATGYFVLKATRGQVLPIDAGRSDVEAAFRGGQGG